MSSSPCLYHSHGGRGLLEHVVNQLTKAGHFSPQHKPYLRRATCSCDPALPKILLPLSALAPKGLDSVSASLGKSGPAIASLAPLLTPKEGKDAPEIALAKSRLLAVVYRMINEPRGRGEMEGLLPGAAPFGFTPEFLAGEIEKAGKTLANQTPREVVSQGVLDLTQDHVGKFIGKNGQNIKALQLPGHLVVHIEDDKDRERQEKKGGKTGGERGTVKITVKAKILEIKKEAKETEEEKKEAKDSMEVDSDPEEDQRKRKRNESKKMKKAMEKKRKEETKKEVSEDKVKERAKELQNATDAALALLMAKAVLFTQQEKEEEKKAIEEDKRREERRKQRRNEREEGGAGSRRAVGHSGGRKYRRTK